MAVQNIDLGTAMRRSQGMAFDDSQVGGQQAAFGQELQRRAMGQGPSVAQEQLRAQTQQNVASQAAMMASRPALNTGMAARSAAYGAANLNQQAAGQGAELRAREMVDASRLYADALQSQRAQDLQRQQLGANLFGNTAQMDISQNQFAAEQELARERDKAARDAANRQMWMQILGGTLGAAGTAATVALTGGAAAPAMMAAQAGKMASNPNGSAVKPYNYAEGGLVPGNAVRAGDHPANDTELARLSPGELVIPRSVMNSPDPAEAAKAFVAGLMAARKAK